MQQKRLILALVLSSAILFLWTFFYPVKPPEPNQPNAAASPSPTATASETPASQTSSPNPSVQQPIAVSTAPQRTIKIKTPLYEATFDTRGAEPVSWIITHNKNKKFSNDRYDEIYSVGGRKSDKVPLQLISPEGLKRQPRAVPLQLRTNDGALNSVLASSTYRVEGIDGDSGEASVDVKGD
jgi:YidC/Oxa1 family membrane protein insertase